MNVSIHRGDGYQFNDLYTRSIEATVDGLEYGLIVTMSNYDIMPGSVDAWCVDTEAGVAEDHPAIVAILAATAPRGVVL